MGPADAYFPQRPAFHDRTGGDNAKAETGKRGVEVTTSPPSSQYGYPSPGLQNPDSAMVMEDVFFVNQQSWEALQQGHDLDYIVIGSGCTGLAFTDEILRLNPGARILMLERGGFWLPEHFQNAPLPFKYTLGGNTETFPWTLTQETFDSTPKYMHGSCPFFGGRSLYWSAWSPSPTPDLLGDWPQEMIDVTLEPDFWPRAKELLNGIPASAIHDELYNELQQLLLERLKQNLERFAPSVDVVEDAPLAVGDALSEVVKFNKFSTPGKLLALYETQQQLAGSGQGEELLIAAGCVVSRLVDDGRGNAVAIDTSRGELPVGNAKVILSLGCFPATTLMLNSFPKQVAPAGSRVTGHFISHIVARVPLEAFPPLAEGLEMAAIYVGGKDEAGNQYHIQITGLHAPDPKSNAIDAARECPDYAAAATPQQLDGSNGHVVLVCAVLGGITPNPDSWFRRNDQSDPTDNCTLQVLLGDQDEALWMFMEQATFQTVETIAQRDGRSYPIEYWHPAPDGVNGKWDSRAPSPKEIRIPGLVHEASTMWMGEEGSAVVGYDYRPYGVGNVFVTGSSIFPISGSWNPTLTMCGYAQDLARELETTARLG